MLGVASYIHMQSMLTIIIHRLYTTPECSHESGATLLPDREWVTSVSGLQFELPFGSC